MGWEQPLLTPVTSPRWLSHPWLKEIGLKTSPVALWEPVTQTKASKLLFLHHSMSCQSSQLKLRVAYHLYYGCLYDYY